MHVLLAIRDQQAAASTARALRNTGMTVDIAMNTRIASAMMAASPYAVVVFEQGLAPRSGSAAEQALGRTAALLEITPADSADPDRLASKVRTFAQGR